MSQTSDRSLLTAARARLGLSQEDVARKFRVSQPAVSLWEQGKYAPPPDKWRRVGKVYGLTFDEVFAFFAKTKARAS